MVSAGWVARDSGVVSAASVGAGRRLLLKQVIEGGAGVCGASGGLGDGGLGGRTRGGDLAGDGDAWREEFALVAGVLGRDAEGDRLEALEAGGGLKVSAELAAVEVGIAFGAGALEVDAVGQGGGAIPAAGGGDVLHHTGEARTGDIDRRFGPLEAGTVVASARALVAVAIHVAVRSILAIAVHGR